MVREAVAEQPPQLEFPAKEDPRNPVLNQKIAHLYRLMTFRKSVQYAPAQQITVPVRPQDFQSAPTVRRLLPRTQPSHYDVTISSGTDLPVEDDNPYLSMGGFTFDLSHISLSIWEGIQVDSRIRNFRLDIDAARAGKVDSDYLISAGVKFSRHLGKRNRDLMKAGINPETVLSELEGICGRQRENFALDQKERAQNLNPMERTVADAWREIGMDIHKASYNRGFSSDFLLKGLLSSKGRLRGLILFFSVASDSGDTPWKDVKGLNGSLRDVSSASLTKAAVLIRREGYKKPARIPILFSEMYRGDTMFPDAISGVATNMFLKFQTERAGIASNQTPSIVLATSLPLSPKG